MSSQSFYRTLPHSKRSSHALAFQKRRQCGPALQLSISRSVTSEPFPTLGHSVPSHTKARMRQTLAAVFMLLTSYTGHSWLGDRLSAAAVIQSTACFSWLSIQSECPANGLPHVTRKSQKHTAVDTW